MPEVIGIDHIYITVSNLKRSAEFYDFVMEILCFRKNTFTLNKEEHIQYFNRYFGYVLRPSHNESKHNRNSAGLHHLCMRVESKVEVHEIHKTLIKNNIKVSEPKLYSEYANDYYAIFFKDPDGIELEITNYRQERRDRHDNW